MTLIPNANLSKARRDDFTTRLTQLRAETAEAKNDIPTAEKLYQELEKLLPKSGYPIWAQGRIKVLNQQLDEGYQFLKRARELDSKLPQPELTMAQVVINSSIADRENVTEKWFREGIRQSTVSVRIGLSTPNGFWPKTAPMQPRR